MAVSPARSNPLPSEKTDDGKGHKIPVQIGEKVQAYHGGDR